MRNYIAKSILVLAAMVTVGSLSAISAQTVSGNLAPVPRGGTATGRLTLSIPSDLHVNSNNPKSKYAIPTTVRVTSPDARIGSVRYPAGKTKKFAFSETPINVYEGNVTFTFSVSVPSTFKGNTVNVKAIVRYQACNDEVCYPPRTKEVTLAAKVR